MGWHSPADRSGARSGAAVPLSRMRDGMNLLSSIDTSERPVTAVESDELWYKDAIIYQLHVKAFADSNNDGIGDFAGLTEKLGYLQDLGVTALWLLPFYPSPGRDDGYDIADYGAINPDFGTMKDFKRFIVEAKRRGLRVITELVINHTSDQHNWFKRAGRDAYAKGKVLLAEANQWPEDVQEYFGKGDECHMAYHFPLMPRIYMAIAQEDRFPIADILRQTPDIPTNCQWALFLRNHDELTLEMVTDVERDYLWSTYANDPRARINVGIRRRLAPLMDNDRRKIELMNSLLLSFPGTPIIYYGDEIGMGDNIYLGDRNGVRTPMQWTPDRNGGFSRCDPARLYLPMIMDPVYGYEAV